jgi:Domain of unknown function (DUF4249)
MRRIITFFGLLVLTSFCRERFEADTALGSDSFLVVDGFINAGDGVTRIKLSRVTPLDESSELVAENSAVVSIEDDENTLYGLSFKSNGLYESDELGLDETKDYRLRIEAGGKVYLSDFTQPTITPNQADVRWTLSEDNEVSITVSTRDPLNETFYYKWEYEEVWEVRSAYISKWAYDNNAPRARTTSEISRMTYCWPRRQNSDLLIATSDSFVADEINDFPLTKFQASDARLGWRYSIIVTQRAVKKEEYEFLQIMKKNTNDLGGFFDAQPSQLFGNIRCTTSDEPVIGFVSAYTSRTVQLFIKHEEISDFDYVTPCAAMRFNALISEPLFNEYFSQNLPLEPIYGPSGEDAAPIIGFVMVQRACADCRFFAGSNPKPDFWVAEDNDDVE